MKMLVESAGGRWRLMYFPVGRHELLVPLAGDDLAWVALEEQVGEVRAEPEGRHQPRTRAPRGQAVVGRDAVEHQPAHHLPPGVLDLVDHVGERDGIGLELLGVSDQMPAGQGLLAQARRLEARVSPGSRGCT
ncbi:hypothetical protein ACWGN5_25595 [Streptomyces sp. NPDC055815]